jgi:RNase P protein component
MIAKKYRLIEKEVKKVLSRRKPFFAHEMVANVLPNTLGYARVAIVLGGKQAPGSVNRNFFRRRTYDLSYPFLA